MRFLRICIMSAESIVLVCFALSVPFAGATALVQYFAEDTQFPAMVFWTFGYLGSVGSTELPIIAIVTLAGFFFLF
ncbi:MAG: iron chelate uptake ABC transporter family permease subunit [Eggerthellaceae bacterium]|nr:iron chelate uptake ABC transporter family permease subunit [Eggerthellaceae bacterium]